MSLTLISVENSRKRHHTYNKLLNNSKAYSGGFFGKNVRGSSYSFDASLYRGGFVLTAPGICEAGTCIATYPHTYRFLNQAIRLIKSRRSFVQTSN